MKNLIMKLSVETILILTLIAVLGFTAYAGTSLTQDQAVLAVVIEEEKTESVPVTSLFTTCIVNLHSEPSADPQTIIKTVPRGTSVLIVGQNGAWSQVIVGADTGYICTQYLATQEEWYAIKDAPYNELVPLGIDLQQYLWNECKDIGMKYCFALALIDQETGGTFKADLVSRTNDWGITQINKCNHKRYIDRGWITCSQDLLNPYNGIHCGLDFMNQYVQMYGCVERAYAQYNTGKPIQSNKNSRSFMKKYEKWKALLGDI